MSTTDNGFGREAEIYSVSELNRAAKSLLEGQFPMVFVEGEISNFSRPASGHWYFTLKDDAGQLRTAMFRNRNMRINFTPKNGLKVLVRGRISLYEARGEFQFIAENMQEAGVGELQRAFEALRRKLQEEGLFDTESKRPIPTLTKHLALITSATGAAVHDVMSVLKRRFPALQCTLIPTQVQGEEATGQVVQALERAARFDDPPFDLILLTRGGGSLEDLWTFNTEPVARAIAASPIPVISAVGHESDVTIADFVADLRAPTPSAAAELIAPDQIEWMQTLDRLAARMTKTLADSVGSKEHSLRAMAKRLRNPAQTLARFEARLTADLRSLRSLTYRAIEDVDLSSFQEAMIVSAKAQLARSNAEFKIVSQRLAPPHDKIQALTSETGHLERRLRASIDQTFTHNESQLRRISSQLEALSPLKTLARGFSITQSEDGQLISQAGSLTPGQLVTLRFSEGKAKATITDIDEL